MLDDKDIQKLMEVLATKEDVRGLKEDVDDLRESVQALTVAIDKLVGAVEKLEQEYTMVLNKIDRHEKWLHQVADKLGIKLQY